MKLNQPLHLTVLRHRKGARPVVIGTKSLDWRAVLYCNSIEVNATIMPIDLTHSGSLGLIQLNLDLHPAMKKHEFITQSQMESQQELEKKHEAESLQVFLDYANAWWGEYK